MKGLCHYCKSSNVTIAISTKTSKPICGTCLVSGADD